MNTKYYALSGFALVVALAACFLAAMIGNRAFKKINTLSGTNPSATLQIDTIQKQVMALDTRITELTGKIDKMASRSSRASAALANVSTDDLSPDALVALNDAMYKLEEIVDASGLKTIATNMAVDPSIMKQVYDEYYDRKVVNEYQTAMRDMNIAQHTADKEQYGEDVDKLYDAAHARGGRGGGRRGGQNNQDNQDQQAAEQAREQAFTDLVDKYPDANATAMLVAERAMGSMFRGNMEDAEKYYSMLTENSQSTEVVTDWGMKAVPTMQYYLANQYIENGQTDKALVIIDQLANSGDDMIFGGGGGRGGRGGGGGPRYQKTSEAVSDLRKRLNQKN